MKNECSDVRFINHKSCREVNKSFNQFKLVIQNQDSYFEKFIYLGSGYSDFLLNIEGFIESCKKINKSYCTPEKLSILKWKILALENESSFKELKQTKLPEKIVD
ncbi:uncharacterized protein ELE39_000573 [Cryptosporidium sp. chipmunk genotype I]|uniref:uncharacterized protein n=1 Tax=Cryptosporidium sp. chipmunk genotype I TaxID=1280935 RepID=UPI00351A9472|nr:hypothetical protein ELE39_000573 [Cryptosporidium sp. chipmunk genotype I]